MFRKRKRIRTLTCYQGIRMDYSTLCNTLGQPAMSMSTAAMRIANKFT
jgi:hypothetical protein